mmetsp:Transcript_125955/g.299000  ORF Transcript_125955/g.299000 Transcript_125955/m.299000 type:complete len:203 (+) Transcript_125955:336-944(+)
MSRLNFHRLRVRDQLLQHAKHAIAARLLLEVLELRLLPMDACDFRCRFLEESGLFGINRLQRCHCFLQEDLGRALLSHNLLELLVFLLAVLTRYLKLLVHFGDLVLQELDVPSQLRDGAVKAFHLRDLGLLFVSFLLCFQLLLLKLGRAPILLLLLCLLLLLEGYPHFVNRLFDLLKGVQLHGERQCGQASVSLFLANLRQQ